MTAGLPLRLAARDDLHRVPVGVGDPGGAQRAGKVMRRAQRAFRATHPRFVRIRITHATNGTEPQLEELQLKPAEV